jgi:hypothetical protein
MFFAGIGGDHRLFCAPMKKKIMVVSALFACMTAQADQVQTRTAVYKGQVTHVEGANVFVKLEQGEFAVPMRDIVRLELDRPAAFDKGLAAAKAGKAQEAVDALKPLVDRLAGLPSPWVMDAMM